MEKITSSFFIDLLFYWLAILPVLAAFTIWLWFWRSRQLVKKFTREVQNAYDQNLSHIQVIPSVHKSPLGENKPPSYKDVILIVDNLSLPSYADAIQISNTLKVPQQSINAVDNNKS